MRGYLRGAQTIALVVGVVILAGVPPGFAQAAKPFVGVWELDRFKSAYDPIGTAPEKRIVTLEAAGDGIKSTARTWRNAVAADVTYTAGFDGKDYPTAAPGATVSFKRVNATTIERTAKLNGTVAETQTWSVSPDGKTMTIKASGTDAAGTPFSSTQIYTKTS